MSDITSAARIPASIPASGKTLLADLTYRTVWADPTLQYYLGDEDTLGFSQSFRNSYNARFDSSGPPDQSFAYSAQIIQAFEMIDSVVDTDFARVTASAQAQDTAEFVLVTSSHSLNASLEGYHMFPGGVSRGRNDYWGFGAFNSDLTSLGARPETGGGEYLNWVLIHEIGHGLGLEHLFDDNGDVLPSIGEALDNERYTVMSYNGASYAYTYGHAVTMMAIDIAALQAQYGVETYAEENSVYTLRDAREGALTLSENNWQIGRAYASIWDSGGTDTIRYLGPSGAVLINLNDATLDRSMWAADAAPSLGALQLTERFATLSEEIRTETMLPDYHAGGFFSRVLTATGESIDGGFSIAHGAQIENATGGTKDDILIGNELDNRLTGAAGDDLLIGGLGDDVLQGGAGLDTAGFSDERAFYTIAAAGNGAYTISHAGEGTDSLVRVELAQFADGLVDLSLVPGVAGIALTGTALGDALEGASGSDTLIGLDGNDTLIGLGSDDQLYGDDGDDLLYGDNIGPRLPMGDGEANLDRTVVVPDAVREGYTAVRMDAGFSLLDDADIGEATTIPHLTASFTMATDDFVYLALDIAAGERLVIDIDYADTDPGGFDSVLSLLDVQGNEIASNDDAEQSSVGGAGSSSRLDSYLDISVEQSGTYFAEIRKFDFSPIPEGEQFEASVSLGFNPTGSPSGGSYEAGNDVIRGGNGNDSLFGGDGADTLYGGYGDDFIYGGESSNDRRDLVYGGFGGDIIDGGHGNDELRGDAGNDTIAGGFGVDTVMGGDGDDVLTGSAWADRLSGGNGDDFINGGFGFDRLNGGAGADRFFHVGVKGHGTDWVRDYNAAEGDLLQTGLLGSARADYRVSFAEIAGVGEIGLPEAFVRYAPTGQILWVLIDGAGQDAINLRAGAAEFDLLH